MKQRVLVAVVLLPPVLYAVWQGGAWWIGLVLIVAALGGYEYFDLLRRGGLQPARWFGLAWLLLLISAFVVDTPLSLPVALTGGLILSLVRSLYQVDRPLLNWAATVAGTVYLGILMGQAMTLRLLPDGLWWLLLALATTWLNDTSAYLIGVSIGRHRIWPRLSPKKSWEGTIGGVLVAAVTGGVVVWLTPLALPFWGGLGLGAMAGVLAFFGDLSVSMIKRQVGAKDSGRLFPGHGGMLDRLDSLLFVVPTISLVAQWWVGG